MTSDHKPIEAEELDALFGRYRASLSAPCALAVSGGSDSTALMVLLADWLRQSRQDSVPHVILTVDHGLRAQSAAEARAVAAQAAALGFRHATLAWDGPKPQTGIQAAAREARYHLMSDYMRAHGIALLFTAHTRDDQAETLLMRLARGSGVDGLSGMERLACLGNFGPGERDETGVRRIARPLLGVPKASLRATLEARGMRWIEDPSNQSPAFERSRLRAARGRLDALGLTDAMLVLSATRLRRARRALNRMAESFFNPSAGAVSIDRCGYFTIDRIKLRKAEAEITVRVMGLAIAAAGGGDEAVPLGKLEAIVEALCSGDASVPGKWTLARAMVTASDQIVSIEREPGRVPLPQLTLEPGAKALWDGRFWVKASPSLEGGSVEVRALGETALGELRRLGAVASRAPSRVIGMVPSVWRGASLVAVPSLEYSTSPDRRDAFAADFIGIGKIGRNLQWLDWPGGGELS